MLTGTFSSDYPAPEISMGALNLDGGTLTLDEGTRPLYNLRGRVPPPVLALLLTINLFFICLHCFSYTVIALIEFCERSIFSFFYQDFDRAGN